MVGVYVEAEDDRAEIKGLGKGLCPEVGTASAARHLVEGYGYAMGQILRWRNIQKSNRDILAACDVRL
jgi:hypothetical protein